MKKIWATATALCLGLLVPLAACGPEGGTSYSTPTGGTGFGEYDVDRTVENGGKTNSIVGASFDPYRVTEGRYAVTVADAESKVYFAFGAGKTGIFSVSSEGDADPCVTQLFGNPIGGIRNLGGEYGSDNISETDKNFKYEFKCDERDMEGAGGVLYFEIGISDPASAGKAFGIVFKYEREYVPEQPIETTVIPVTEQFKEFETPSGTLIMPDAIETFSMDFTPVLGTDGYYHKGAADGPLLYALIKTPARPFGYTADDPTAFDTINTADPGNFIFSDGKTYRYNYISFVETYIAHANDAGIYPCTEEWAEFLRLYVTRDAGTLSFIEEKMMKVLPEGYEWLAGCGYYE